MALKTFNVDNEVYKKYSSHCKEHGISMSKQVERFMKMEVDKINFNMKVVKDESEKEHHPMKKYC